MLRIVLVGFICLTFLLCNGCGKKIDSKQTKPIIKSPDRKHIRTFSIKKNHQKLSKRSYKAYSGLLQHYHILTKKKQKNIKKTIINTKNKTIEKYKSLVKKKQAN